MGVDIHLAVEVQNADGSWERHTAGSDIFGTRNTNFFTVIANVRRRDSDILTIADPRGLPDDMSEETADDDDIVGEDSDRHSRSWVTDAEMRAYDWEQIENCWPHIENEERRLTELFGRRRWRIVFSFDS